MKGIWKVCVPFCHFFCKSEIISKEKVFKMSNYGSFFPQRALRTAEPQTPVGQKIGRIQTKNIHFNYLWLHNKNTPKFSGSIILSVVILWIARPRLGVPLHVMSDDAAVIWVSTRWEHPRWHTHMSGNLLRLVRRRRAEMGCWDGLFLHAVSGSHPFYLASPRHFSM